MDSKVVKSHIGLISATLIYGITYTIAKKVMPEYISPYGFVLLRNLGAFLFFWMYSFSLPKQSIEKKDYLRLLGCAIFGIVLNQFLFFKGLEYTTPISGSIIMTLTPIVVLILSYFILKLPLTRNKVAGVFLGLIGAYLIIFENQDVANESFKAVNPLLGNIFVFINCVSYGVYLVLAKKLMEKYNPVYILKWMITIALFFMIPIGGQELSVVKWDVMPLEIYSFVFFIVLGTSCLAYLFNLYALNHVKPTTVSTYIYGQPLIATCFAVFMGADQLTLVKIIAAVLIFTAVYLVSKNMK